MDNIKSCLSTLMYKYMVWLLSIDQRQCYQWLVVNQLMRLICISQRAAIRLMSWKLWSTAVVDNLCEKKISAKRLWCQYRRNVNKMKAMIFLLHHLSHRARIYYKSNFHLKVALMSQTRTNHMISRKGNEYHNITFLQCIILCSRRRKRASIKKILFSSTGAQ